MRTLKTVSLVLMAVALLVTAAQAKSFTFKKVKGSLEASDDESNAKGKFLLGIVLAGDDTKERLIVVGKGLDPDLDYEVYLGESVDDGVSFGELTVRGRGYGYLKIRKDDFPDDADSLMDFSGESIFVVTDGETVLEGEIPEFVDPDPDDEAGEGSLAFGFGETKLEVPDDVETDARARLFVASINTYRGAREMLTLMAVRLDDEETYGVYVVNDDADDDELGSLSPRTRWGIATLVLDTGRDDELPDHLGELGGKTIEVRNADGDVILTGEIPTLN